ncbi:MASE4 domain-containing protein [Pseudoduganella namucuonensis]|uniref:histidine kinase n=1 Tax=Pseudoduganella namucuonensis TaxID=1035707 RepID=A0A1I7JVA9_9BURK|nr:MASE4 domain-containing protein [Pseudoduganella namucuonensis]SFU89114.1 PAS domain S-box-containing protein [Pseudoduganella namucuonensis]
MATLLPVENLPLLPTMPVEPHARRLAMLVVLTSIVVFLAVVPFAKVKLAPVHAFIPIYESALLLNDLITAAMLFGHFSILRSRALLVLACGYLYTGVITIPHALTFPGVFAPAGLLGAGAQSTAWLYVFWHVGFPLCVMAYAWSSRRERGQPRLIQRPRLAAAAGIAVALAMVGAATLLSTVHHDALPPILESGRYTLAGNVVLTSTWIFSAVAVVMLWRYTRHSMLDLWLFVVMCAWICDVALSAVLNGGRFDVGFYAGRIYGLLAASYVLVVLLLESNRLYARLAVSHGEALRRSGDLQRLHAQSEERAGQYACALDELHYKDEEIRAVVQNIVDCVITLDAKGVVRSANPAVRQVFGYAADEVVGRDILTLIPELEYDAYFRPRETQDHAQGLDASGEVEGLHKNGQRIPLELAINEFEVHDERLFIGVLREISERKRFISELWQARANAEEANKAKSAFLANMSHELRTPLNAILGFAQILVSDTLPLTADKRRHFTTHILKAGKHLLELINEVLDLAKVESGTLSLSPEPVELAELIVSCQQMIEPIADKRGIGLVFSVDAGLHVLADRTRLKQVLLNLMSNAVKYNRPGGAVHLGCTSPAAGRVRITVRDDGEGLAPAQLEQLFQPFSRLGREADTEEGTGIGLVVTKRLVELMGGEIGVSSTEGVGSVFWVELRSAIAVLNIGMGEALARAKASAPAGDKPLAQPVRTLLYVEDNPANLALVREILAFRRDLVLMTATDAGQGLEMARRHQPVVILMDINLPGMSGNEAMEILRADPETAHVPVIALSANAMPRDVAKSMATGFHRYLTKPIDIDEFFAALDGALELAQEEPCGKSRKKRLQG